MVYCVEVVAIYELPGAAVNNQRRNARDQDFNQAGSQSALRGHAIPPQSEEYLVTFDANRYGFGWFGRQWIATPADASSLGSAIFAQLAGRNLQAGSKVLVFPLDETIQRYTTGAVSYARYWPTPNAGDVG